MIFRRLARLIRGDFAVFDEIATDPKATVESMTISGIASAIGTVSTLRTTGALALGIVAGLVGLAGWCAVLWGTGRGVGGEARFMSLIRAIGYTAPPFALSGVPILGVAAVIGSVALQVVVVGRLHKISGGMAAVAVVAPWIVLVLFGVAIQASS